MTSHYISLPLHRILSRELLFTLCPKQPILPLMRIWRTTRKARKLPVDGNKRLYCHHSRLRDDILGCGTDEELRSLADHLPATVIVSSECFLPHIRKKQIMRPVRETGRKLEVLVRLGTKFAQAHTRPEHAYPPGRKLSWTYWLS